MHEDLIPSILNALQESRLDPEFLKLEITESAAMLHADQVLRKLNTLKELKIKLALDDFGTGYSSLHYLKKLPVDILKIDRSFISDIDYDEDEFTIVKALIEVAHRLGMTVIAEGVETEQQKEKLRTMNCDHIQGYVFSKPLPSEEVERLIAPVYT